MALLAGVGVMVVAPAASAQIVVGQGIAGVKIGDSEAQVLKVLGQPKSKAEIGTVGSSWYYPDREPKGVVGFNPQGAVIALSTFSKQQKTNKGIGVGSSIAQVRKAYPKAKCVTGAEGPQSIECEIRSSYNGQVIETYFNARYRKAGVDEVDVNVAEAG